jgi:hypothetical protein
MSLTSKQARKTFTLNEHNLLIKTGWIHLVAITRKKEERIENKNLFQWIMVSYFVVIEFVGFFGSKVSFMMQWNSWNGKNLMGILFGVFFCNFKKIGPKNLRKLIKLQKIK